MAKFLLVAAALAGSASAFAPASLARSGTSLNAFANGMVGGEGPEPIPLSSQFSSKEWDPAGFAEVCILYSFLLPFLLLLVSIPLCASEILTYLIFLPRCRFSMFSYFALMRMTAGS